MYPQIPDDPNVIKPILDELKQTFLTHKTKNISFRKQQLKKLLQGIQDLEQECHIALEKDLGVTQANSIFTSTMITKADIENQINNLSEWSKEQHVDTPLIIGPGCSKIVYEPYGVALVMSAWNYPIYLAIPPMAAAIAAGNCVVLKPSELSPYSSKVLVKLVTQYLDQTCYRVIEGAIEISKAITTYPFDLIIFTGSPEKGKLVAKAAAENLVPVILELGGKSPTIVDKDCNINVATQRIIQGRYINAGQTCVACDYVFVHETILDKFVQELKKQLLVFFGENPKNSQDFSRIVTQFHTKRLESLLDANDHKGQIICGGTVDIEEKYVAPTIIVQPNINSKVMTEEIFGPILPILTFKDIQETIQFINQRHKPLALYYFGSSSKNKKLLEQQTSSGAFVVNDTIFHLANPNLPFGGVGNSGQSAYHGIYGFKNCSHAKPVFEKSTLNCYPFNVRYPPFTKSKIETLKLFFKFPELSQRQVFQTVLLVALVGTTAYAQQKGKLRKLLEISKPYLDKLYKSANL